MFKLSKLEGFYKKKIVRGYRIFTRDSRMQPSFFIIGTQKGGTTSLFNYMVQHPRIVSGETKETHFFSYKYNKGINHYRSLFPRKKAGFITGEATPCYFFLKHAPKFIFQHYPNAKFIVLLRNPTDRAFSHYSMALKRKRETLSFEDAFWAEDDRLKDEWAKMKLGLDFNRKLVMRASYKSRGLYSEHLEWWLKFFPLDKLLFLNSEDFFSDPKVEFDKVLDFLELENNYNIEFKVYNKGKYTSSLDESVRHSLDEFYKPYNDKLFQMIGQTFDW